MIEGISDATIILYARYKVQNRKENVETFKESL